jgi:hypothetical protein
LGEATITWVEWRAALRNTACAMGTISSGVPWMMSKGALDFETWLTGEALRRISG